MNTDAPIKTDEGQRRGRHDDVTQRAIGVFYEVYNELGYGFVESVYAEAMRVALTASGLQVATEVPIGVLFRGLVIGTFRADLTIKDRVLVELKACDALVRQHESQTLNYLRATQIEVALLMNFGPEARFKRLMMDNEKKIGRSAFIGVKPFSSGGTE